MGRTNKKRWQSKYRKKCGAPKNISRAGACKLNILTAYEQLKVRPEDIECFLKVIDEFADNHKPNQAVTNLVNALKETDGYQHCVHLRDKWRKQANIEVKPPQGIAALFSNNYWSKETVVKNAAQLMFQVMLILDIIDVTERLLKESPVPTNVPVPQLVDDSDIKNKNDKENKNKDNSKNGKSNGNNVWEYQALIKRANETFGIYSSTTKKRISNYVHDVSIVSVGVVALGIFGVTAAVTCVFGVPWVMLPLAPLVPVGGACLYYGGRGLLRHSGVSLKQSRGAVSNVIASKDFSVGEVMKRLWQDSRLRNDVRDKNTRAFTAGTKSMLEVLQCGDGRTSNESSATAAFTSMKSAKNDKNIFMNILSFFASIGDGFGVAKVERVKDVAYNFYKF